jgi:ferredoxin-thioredoxin reductase catalytic subunit
LTNKSDIQKFVNEYAKTHSYVLNPDADYAANALMADANLKYHIGKILRCAHNKLKEV